MFVIKSSVIHYTDISSRQTTLSEATLLPMGKGFAITTNLNLGEMLLTGYSRHCSSFTTRNTSTNHSPKPQSHTQLPKLRVAAITNDTVATFVSLAYTVKATPNSRVVMGLIVGTGTNATVPMTPTALHPTKRNHLSSLGDTDTVVINTEWTIRGTDKPLDALGLKTKWDRILDEQSEAPGFQPFEYMTSGRYLGEIVRLAFTDIAGTDDTPPSLHCRNSLPTQFLSEVVARSDEPTLLHQLQTTYPSTSGFWSPQRTQLLRAIAQAVQRRSSALIAAACIGLLDCVGEVRLDGDAATHKEDRDGAASHEQPDVEELVIAYTGSTISQYPHWLDDCQKWINELVGALGVNVGKAVVLREVREGGVIGAGVLAGMGDRIV
jgi:hexokinase